MKKPILDPAVLAYFEQFTPEEQVTLHRLRDAILEVLPKGYQEVISYKMLGYVVPLSLYPEGYLNDPKVPLPYIAIAKQKHHFAFYTMGIFLIKDLFEEEKAKYEKEYGRLDHGLSCLRYRKPEKIAYPMIQKLVAAISVEEFIAWYKRSREKT